MNSQQYFAGIGLAVLAVASTAQAGGLGLGGGLSGMGGARGVSGMGSFTSQGQWGGGTGSTKPLGTTARKAGSAAKGTIDTAKSSVGEVKDGPNATVSRTAESTAAPAATTGGLTANSTAGATPTAARPAAAAPAAATPAASAASKPAATSTAPSSSAHSSQSGSVSAAGTLDAQHSGAANSLSTTLSAASN